MTDIVEIQPPADRLYREMWAAFGPDIIAAMNGPNEKKSEILTAVAMLAGSALGLLCGRQMIGVKMMWETHSECVLETAANVCNGGGGLGGIH